VDARSGEDGLGDNLKSGYREAQRPANPRRPSRLVRKVLLLKDSTVLEEIEGKLAAMPGDQARASLRMRSRVDPAKYSRNSLG
jgi:hypothetical protein